MPHGNNNIQLPPVFLANREDSLNEVLEMRRKVPVGVVHVHGVACVVPSLLAEIRVFMGFDIVPEEELKDRFRRMRLLIHPDKNAGQEEKVEGLLVWWNSVIEVLYPTVDTPTWRAKVADLLNAAQRGPLGAPKLSPCDLISMLPVTLHSDVPNLWRMASALEVYRSNVEFVSEEYQTDPLRKQAINEASSEILPLWESLLNSVNTGASTVGGPVMEAQLYTWYDQIPLMDHETWFDLVEGKLVSGGNLAVEQSSEDQFALLNACAIKHGEDIFGGNRCIFGERGHYVVARDEQEAKARGNPAYVCDLDDLMLGFRSVLARNKIFQNCDYKDRSLSDCDPDAWMSAGAGVEAGLIRQPMHHDASAITIEIWREYCVLFLVTWAWFFYDEGKRLGLDKDSFPLPPCSLCFLVGGEPRELGFGQYTCGMKDATELISTGKCENKFTLGSENAKSLVTHNNTKWGDTHLPLVTLYEGDLVAIGPAVLHHGIKFKEVTKVGTGGGGGTVLMHYYVGWPCGRVKRTKDDTEICDLALHEAQQVAEGKGKDIPYWKADYTVTCSDCGKVRSVTCLSEHTTLSKEWVCKDHWSQTIDCDSMVENCVTYSEEK